MQETQSKPIAVLISDIHYNLQTLQVADAALNLAICKANELAIPLIIAGDLHDTKANMRAECINAMLSTFNTLAVPCYVLRGNHDQINEKSEDHSLNFLRGLARIVDSPMLDSTIGSYLIPYHHDKEVLKAYLATLPKGSRLIMHQGIEGSNMGDYIQDKSAISTEDLRDFRVISGHYHTRQDIKCGRPRKGAVGLASYIGNPYTLNYAEANDPAKGFQILMSDGTLQFVPTKLRKHVVINVEYVNHSLAWQITSKTWIDDITPNDLVLLKVKANKEQLATMTKEKMREIVGLENFRMDLIPNEVETKEQESPALANPDLLDAIINDTTGVSDEGKTRLKALWRDLA